MAYVVSGTVNPPWYVNVEFDGEKLSRAGRLGLDSATPYNPASGPFPTSGYTERPRKRIPDYMDRWSLQFVSENFRQVVEELEPGLHEFFPFQLRNGKRGDPAPQQYYVMNIMTLCDCIDYEQGGVSVDRFHDGRIAFFSPEKIWHEGMVLKKDIVAGKHLWLAGEVS
ncbi:MAG: DUF1629 domain-containing protein [Litoreibacter sp.]